MCSGVGGILSGDNEVGGGGFGDGFEVDVGATGNLIGAIAPVIKGEVSL